MKYDREYFLAHHESGYVVIRARPSPGSTDAASVLLNALGGDRVVAGTIDELAQDGVWVSTDDTYVQHLLLANAFPVGPVLLGGLAARERVPYESIVAVEGLTPQ